MFECGLCPRKLRGEARKGGVPPFEDYSESLRSRPFRRARAIAAVNPQERSQH